MANKKLVLSVLDQTPVREGGSASKSIQESLELAKTCDMLGYRRYWFAEHHASPSLAGPAPEIMITRIAAATKNIRVGSGGVMLGHYSPLKIAETFSVLENLYPGRIDLGIGRAPGSDQLTAAALAYGSEVGVEYFPTRVADLMAFLTNGEHPTELFNKIKMSPQTETLPQLWMLGSSDQSAIMAAQFGLAFSFAQFIAPTGGHNVISQYKKLFQKSRFSGEPDASIGIFIICGENEKDAKQLSECRDLSLLMRDKGHFLPFPTLKQVRDYQYSDLDLKIIEKNRSRSLFGTPNQCKNLIEEMAEEYGVNEVTLLTMSPDIDSRKKSYQLISEVFGL